LGRLGTALASELDGDRLAQRIVDEATALTGAQFGVLLHHLPPEGGGPAQPYAYCGLHPEDFARFPTAATHALFCPALRTEPVIRSDDLAGDPRFAQQPALRDFVLPVASILAVPITSRSGAVMGGLFLGHVAAGVFTPEHERLIVNVAAQAAVALDNARLFAQVRNAEQQRQLNEDRLSHALEAGRMGYYDWDVPGGRTVMSPRLEELLGIVPGSSDGSVEAFQRAIHPEDRALVQERLQQLLTEPLRKHVTFEHRTSPGPDGACRWLECASRCVRDAGGQPLRVVGVVSDITERHRAQEAREAHAAELARSNAELERSNAELEQFAYVASHDLQEPLRMVASYTQLLSRRYKGKLDPDADEFISFAVEGVTRMKRLIGDLLTYARLGNKRHEPLPLSCDKALERALGNLKAAIDETGARVISTPLPTLLGDELQIELLLQNLVGNAIKFRGTEPPVIHVSAARHEDEWVVSVSDNGIGIEPQYFSRIFVIFQRLHSPQEYTGTGIGLAICKKIVERHNGRIWVDSELGRGSTFRFALPVPPMLEARLQKLA
jgi:PAS domain S-box-containing protein